MLSFKILAGTEDVLAFHIMQMESSEKTSNTTNLITHLPSVILLTTKMMRFTLHIVILILSLS